MPNNKPLTKEGLLEVMEPFMVSIADEFSKAGGERQDLKTDVGELKTDVKQLKTDVGELKTDVSQLKTDMSEVKSDVGWLKTGAVTKSYLDDKMADLTSDINISRGQEIKMIKLLINFLRQNKVFRTYAFRSSSLRGT